MGQLAVPKAGNHTEQLTSCLQARESAAVRRKPVEPGGTLSHRTSAPGAYRLDVQTDLRFTLTFSVEITPGSCEFSTRDSSSTKPGGGSIVSDNYRHPCNNTGRTDKASLLW
ncbi:hypothetical protein Bbelb_420440 [Branchiostoma belcheri]|nr:hypothetical protein Bbelb_420440 [Branchiostoma belcheri]